MGYELALSPLINTDSGVSQGGVVLIIQDQPNGSSVESVRFHISNVVSCEFVVGGKRTPLIGVYLPPSTMYHLLELEEALPHFRY